MTITDDGDIVKDLGFVTLYAAYMEEALEECAGILKDKNSFPPREISKGPISKLIDDLENSISRHQPLPPDLGYFPELLVHIRTLVERRNEVIHGRIYAGLGGQEAELRPSRPSRQVRQIDSRELYDLANSLFGTLGALRRAYKFSLKRLSVLPGN
jgi:hypothetical protein